jgi:hypothetical protein
MELFILIILGLAVLLFAAIWRIFEKAGRQGWEALIPIYSAYVLTKIIDKPGYWVLLMCIPYIGLIWAIWSTNLLSKKFGKDVGFTIGLIFLPFIFYPILAWGDAQYQGEKEDFENHPEILDSSFV